jgi:hypothetical protein
MKKQWHGLVKILEIQHIRNGKVIWEDKNLYNTLHIGGEAYILSCVFSNPNNSSMPPQNYYFGLDNRTSISVDDLITDLADEPSGGGYLRQPVSPIAKSPAINQPFTSEFAIEDSNGIYRAISKIVTFNASGTGWGPVNNLFLATSIDNTGILISSNKLTSQLILVDGDAVNMRMGLSLRDESVS